jgi:hypothetical protein
MIFTIRGVLCEKDLPLLAEKPTYVAIIETEEAITTLYRTTPERYKFLRQGVTITGLGTPTFEKAVEVAQEVYEVLKREFPEGQLEGWTASNFRGHYALGISNRYFTPIKDAKDMAHIPFDSVVDPRGILESMAKAGYIHSEENIVQYYTREIDEQGKHRLVVKSKGKYEMCADREADSKRRDHIFFESGTSSKSSCHSSSCHSRGNISKCAQFFILSHC